MFSITCLCACFILLPGEFLHHFVTGYNVATSTEVSLSLGRCARCIFMNTCTVYLLKVLHTYAFYY